jgi:hypothetical protein
MMTWNQTMPLSRSPTLMQGGMRFQFRSTPLTPLSRKHGETAPYLLALLKIDWEEELLTTIKGCLALLIRDQILKIKAAAIILVFQTRAH